MGEVNYSIVEADIIRWCKKYDGPKFHAIFTDAPYHLTSIVKRFSKGEPEHTKTAKDIAGRKTLHARQAAGFMNEKWDGGDLAFQSETWAAMVQHLHPGGFVVSYGGSRSWHRLACAMEDAGLIIHPTIGLFGMAFGTGFKKGTGVRDAAFEGHQYGLQALSPALEPIIVGQKPYKGRPRDCIARTGAGTWNIDGGRIGTATVGWGGAPSNGYSGGLDNREPGGRPVRGRWPSNLILHHHPDCRLVGVKEVSRRRDENPIQDEGRTDKSQWHIRPTPATSRGYADSNGKETIPDWRCHPDCPVRALDEMSGESGPHGHVKNNTSSTPMTNVYQGGLKRKDWQAYSDSGTAARYFYQGHFAHEIYEQLNAALPISYIVKPGKKEKWFYCQMCNDSFPLVQEQNHTHGKPEDEWREHIVVHPTVKSIALNKYLSTLLLPPAQYALRRILVPFAGVGSEMIGCLLAGWEEIIGVEITSKYIPIAQARLDWWAEQMRWGHTDVEKVLSFISAPDNEEGDYEQLGLF